MPKHLRGRTILTKRYLKRHRGSSTPGIQKCIRCQATPEHRIICSRNRSYKRKDYIQKMKELNKKVQC